MTNILIKDPKNVKMLTQTQPKSDKSVVKLALVILRTLAHGFWASLTVYAILVLLYFGFNNQPDSLGSDWYTQTGNGQPKISEAIKCTPEQLHLSLGSSDTEFYATWSTMEPVNLSKISYCQQDQLLSGCLGSTSIAEAEMSLMEFSESDENWIQTTKRSSRKIISYRAKMTGLEPGKSYLYRVASYCLQGADMYTFYSKVYQFHPKEFSNPDATINLTMYGDLGLINPQSVPRLIQDIDESKVDMIIHNGDFAYDLNTHHGKYGDEFMRLIEPIAARVPYQTSVGNHEIANNFSHYDHRFTMINSAGPNYGKFNNFYYSFNAGPIHFVAFSTEFYYFLNSVGIEPLHNQYEWLKKDLKIASSAEERAKRPWIIVFGHRPMYCSSRDRDDCSKDSNILRKGLPFVGTYALEKLFYDHGVDVELYSHEHQYERFLPIYNAKVMNGTDDPKDPYLNPNGPVHIISGSAGCQERLDPFKGNPVVGSIVQLSDYGYTRLEASRCQLKFSQISDDQTGKVVDHFVIRKTEQVFPKRSGLKFECNPEATIKRLKVEYFSDDQSSIFT